MPPGYGPNGHAPEDYELMLLPDGWTGAGAEQVYSRWREAPNPALLGPGPRPAAVAAEEGRAGH